MMAKSELDMDLSIIIVNWNTRELLKNCLESIRQHKGSCKIKIIVVDNVSKDGSREMVETLFPEVKLINSGGNIGFGRANNLGIPYADTPLILFLNPDTLVMNGTFERMMDFIKSHALVGAMSCMITYGPDQDETLGTDGEAHTLGLQWFPSPFTELLRIILLSDKMIQRLKRYLPYKNPNESGYVSKLYGTCLMVRREVLEQCGYFDERFFMYGEDVDLCRRITDAGWKLYYMSEVKIAHLAGGAGDKTASQFGTLMTCESISQLMEKYHGKLGKYAYRIVIFIGSNVRLLLLLMLKIISALSFLHKNRNYKSSFNKYAAMVKWSLGLKKPLIKH
jgi:GT2 family glycosyltransferase